jgi:16S rRNA (guanine527-N7)-methyltransferase
VAEPDRASTRAASAPDAVSDAVPPALREAALAVFGDRLSLASRYASLLVTAGVERGLIGPREAPRIWDRHLLNCAVVGELIPSGLYVVDVGSGAGLPGIVLAVARPDLRISLVESLARRTAFLSEVVSELGLSSVDVVRARAEECVNVLPPADVVTARAVAPLDRLASWCLPLARPGGVMLAIKGSSAAAEIEEHRAAVGRLGGGPPGLVQCGTQWLAEPATVVEVRHTGPAGSRDEKKRSRGPARAGRSPGNRGARGAGGSRGTRSGDGGDHPTK